MEIVKLNKQNLEDLCNIDETAFKSVWTKNTFLNELQEPTRVYYGVKKDNKIIAYVGLNVILDECDIIRIAVLKEEQNKGVAKFLLNGVLQKLKKDNIKKVMLEVSVNNSNAIKLYLGLGFNQIFKRDSYYEDGTSALIFELNL